MKLTIPRPVSITALIALCLLLAATTAVILSTGQAPTQASAAASTLPSQISAEKAFIKVMRQHCGDPSGRFRCEEPHTTKAVCLDTENIWRNCWGTYVEGIYKKLKLSLYGERRKSGTRTCRATGKAVRRGSRTVIKGYYDRNINNGGCLH